MLTHYNGDIKPLFNRSGKDYRELNMKEKVNTLSQEKLLSLLNNNGNLVKRPFLISRDIKLLGFNQDNWSNTLLMS